VWRPSITPEIRAKNQHDIAALVTMNGGSVVADSFNRASPTRRPHS
jgi:hypothetical protein